MCQPASPPRLPTADELVTEYEWRVGLKVMDPMVVRPWHEDQDFGKWTAEPDQPTELRHYLDHALVPQTPLQEAALMTILGILLGMTTFCVVYGVWLMALRAVH